MNCIGRFQFSLPDNLVITGRSQSIYTVDVSTVPAGSGGVVSLWQDRLTRIRGLSPPQNVQQVVARTFELQSGVPAVWYFNNAESADLLALETMKQVADHVLIVNRGAYLEAPARRVILQGGGEPTVEKLVKNVVDAYVPAAPNGFCIGYGSITSEPSRNEQTRIAFSYRSMADVKLRIETRTVNEPDHHTYSHLDEERQLAAGQGSRMTLLADASRTVAALAGREIRISIAAAGAPPFVRFTWHFAGVTGRSDQPAIDIVGMADSEHAPQLQATWDSLLASFRALPIKRE